MGLATPTPARADSFRDRAALVTVGSIVMGTAALAGAAAVLIALVAYGWREIGWVLTAPGAQGVLQPLAMTGLIVSAALPIVCAVGALAAAAMMDPSIGGVAGRALRACIEWTAGIPPVVVGTAVFVSAAAFGWRSPIAVAIVTLVLLNLPNAAARMARSLGTVPPEVREASAAVGASASASFVGVLAPQAAWPAAAAVLALAAQMAGETSALALAIGAHADPEPLSVHIWHYASNSSLAGTEAASCGVLALAIAALLASSRACARRGAHEGTVS